MKRTYLLRHQSQRLPAYRHVSLVFGALTVLCLGLLQPQQPRRKYRLRVQVSARRAQRGAATRAPRREISASFGFSSDEGNDRSPIWRRSWLRTELLPAAATAVFLITIALGGRWAYSGRRRIE